MVNDKIVPEADSDGTLYNSDTTALASEITLEENPSSPVNEKGSIVSVQMPENKIEVRDKWDRPIEFLLACIAMSVGLGNIWRFPVIAANNGGGAFLIPYMIVLLVIGRPMYLMELCLGQFTSCSQINCWKICPFFKGVGYASCIATAAVMTYYTSLMSLSIFYVFASFADTLPWSPSRCDIKADWTKKGCFNATALDPSKTNKTIPDLYFKNYVLNEKDNIDDGIGWPDWRLSLCLLFSWLTILASHFYGLKSSGKFAYFTALFPYVVLFVLLVRGLTLPGAIDGLEVLFVPQWGKILEAKVWLAAVVQCFFSLNVGFGSIIMFSSYNTFHQNIYRDVVVVSLMDTGTSLLAGVTIFSIIGFLVNGLGKTVKEALKNDVDAGAGLAFISYAAALAQMPWAPQFFSVLFFLMLFTLGLGSSTSDAGAVMSVFSDGFPRIPKRLVTVVVCAYGMCAGLIFVTPGGQWIFELVDFYGGGMIILFTIIFEIIAISWVYGVDNFIADVEFMLKIKLGWYWKICWKYVVPPMLIILMVYSLYQDPYLATHGDSKSGYPIVATVFGWLLVATALSFMPGMAIYAMMQESGSISERFFKSLKPAADYGPDDPEKRLEWIAFKTARGPCKASDTEFLCACGFAFVLYLGIVLFCLSSL